MWFIGVEVEQEKSAAPPTKNPWSVPGELARRLSSWVQDLPRSVDKTDRETTLDQMSYFMLYSRNIACPTLTETVERNIVRSNSEEER